MEKKPKCRLLVTGAAGFIGRSVIREILSESGSDNSEFGLFSTRYDHIIALDMCHAEHLAAIFDHSSRILPLQMNLSDITERESLSYAAMRSLLTDGVDCIIHTAGVVDTRENDDIRRMLRAVHVEATGCLFDLANECGVSRFVHLSSVSAAVIRRDETNAPWYQRYFLSDSMFSSLLKSSYGASKKEGEEVLLRQWNTNRRQQQQQQPATSILAQKGVRRKISCQEGDGSSIRLVILRPHVVWGRGDPLATDIMVDWPLRQFDLPRVLMGDKHCDMVAVHARLLSRFIMLADTALSYVEVNRDKGGDREEEKQEIALPGREKDAHCRCFDGQIVNVGEERLTLVTMCQRIVETYCPDVTKKVSVWTLPSWLATAVVLGVRALDLVTLRCFSSRWSIFRLVTANNLAYVTDQFFNPQSHLHTFDIECSTLYEAAASVATTLRNKEVLPTSYLDWKKRYGAPGIGADIRRGCVASTSNIASSNVIHSWGVGVAGRKSSSQHSAQNSCGSSSLKDSNKTAKGVGDFSPVSSFCSSSSSSSSLSGTALPSLFPADSFAFVTQHRLSQSWELGPITLRNRVIKAATFECMGVYGSGVPTEQLIDFHAEVAAGGAALTIVAYVSVSDDGRSFPTQISLGPRQKPEWQEQTHHMLKRLCDAVHDRGGKVCLQLTHAGAFADPSFNNQLPAMGPSRIFNPLTMRWSTSLYDDDKAMERIACDFERAVGVCRNVIGCDAVELHLGHGYLLSQFLSRRTCHPSHRDDAKARLAFPLAVLNRVCAAAHDNRCATITTTATAAPSVAASVGASPIAVLVKFNVSELDGELDLPHADVRYFARAFLDAGADLLVPSGGHVMVNGLHMLRGAAPIKEMADAQGNWFKKTLLRLLGWYLVPTERFSEGFFRASSISALLGAGIPLSKMCLIGGVHDIRTLTEACGEECSSSSSSSSSSTTSTSQIFSNRGYGFAAVQLGRVLLADPNFCIKTGIFIPTHNDPLLLSRQLLARQEVNFCDNSNRCIVGATMALTPLKCEKYCADAKNSCEW